VRRIASAVLIGSPRPANDGRSVRPDAAASTSCFSSGPGQFARSRRMAAMLRARGVRHNRRKHVASGCMRLIGLLPALGPSSPERNEARRDSEDLPSISCPAAFGADLNRLQNHVWGPDGTITMCRSVRGIPATLGRRSIDLGRAPGRWGGVAACRTPWSVSVPAHLGARGGAGARFASRMIFTLDRRAASSSQRQAFTGNARTAAGYPLSNGWPGRAIGWSNVFFIERLCRKPQIRGNPPRKKSTASMANADKAREARRTALRRGSRFYNYPASPHQAARPTPDPVYWRRWRRGHGAPSATRPVT